VYGIVTNAIQWVFLRWAGFSDKPTIEVSHFYNCSLAGDLDEKAEKEVLDIVGYLISILQSQVHGLKNPKQRHRIKRRRS
jgi:hypothetical protein